MSDDPGPGPDAPLIDVRSPGERFADSGRAGFDRLRVVIEKQRLDAAAFAWMFCILLITCAEIYSALRLHSIDGFPGGGDWWNRLQFLSQSGGEILIFGSAIGILLAVTLDSPTARRALRLATIGGVWSALCGLLGIAVSFHTENGVTPAGSLESKVVDSLYYFAFAGLGLIIAIVAWRFATADVS